MRKSSEMEPRGGGLRRRAGPQAGPWVPSARPSSDLSHGRGPTRRGCGAERGLGTPGRRRALLVGPAGPLCPARLPGSGPLGRRRRRGTRAGAARPARPPWRSPGRGSASSSCSSTPGRGERPPGSAEAGPPPGPRGRSGAGLCPARAGAPSPGGHAGPAAEARLTRKPSGVGGWVGAGCKRARRAPSPRSRASGPRTRSPAVRSGDTARVGDHPPAGQTQVLPSQVQPQSIRLGRSLPSWAGREPQRAALFREKPGSSPPLPRLPPPSSGPS